MKFITRKHRLNRTWSAIDIDAAAEFWLRLYETAAAAQNFTARPDHITEVRLRGFPRAEGPLLEKELARRAANSDFRQPVVELKDPDTLVLTSKLTRPTESPPEGLGLPLLEGPGFDGLMVEFRITAVGGEGKLLSRAHLSFTLVLVGQVIDGVFVLQTLWRSGSSEWEDELCWYGEWPNAAEWLEALDHFREDDKVPLKLAKVVCVPRGADRFGSLIVKLINVPLGKPRLARLVWRWLFFAFTFGVAAFVVWWCLHIKAWFGLLVVAATTWWIFFASWRFVLNESRLWFTGYRLFHAAYSTLHREVHQLGAVAPEIVAQVTNNPTVQKYTADLQSAGFVHTGDVMTEPQSFGQGMFRVFSAPDGVTHLAIVFSFTTARDPERAMHTWPANVAFVAHTHFADGGFAVSANGRSTGYRRKRTGPEVLSRIFPDETDPLDFMQKHMKAARAFAEASGIRVVPAGSLAEYVRRQNAMLEEDQRYFVGSPYTWGDHFWWYLQTPRKVFRE